MEYLADELHKLNENIEALASMLERKLGGEEDNLNVTLFADKPLKITYKEEN